MSGPRTLFLDHAAALGGAELSLLALAAAWPGERRVLLFEDGPFLTRLGAAGVPVAVAEAGARVRAVSREGGLLADLRAVPGALALVARVARAAREADLVWANSQKAFAVGAVAAAAARRPLVWHLRDLLTADHFSGGHRRLVVALANRLAARVVANSEATGAAFVAAGGRAALVRVVPNGIDPAPFEAVTDAEAAAARAGLGVGEGPLVGAFSRLAPWKGQHVLVEALAALPGVRAVVVGGALFGEDAYARALRERAAALGVADRVAWAGVRDDVPTLMRACDVVVHTSTAPEPFGRVVVEGMLAGRPVVAADAGGPREILTDGTGRLVRPGDPAALADAVHALLADPEGARALAAAGRERARTAFSEGAMVAGAVAVAREAAA